ncbi:hypothetical protein ACFP81_12045 [Deinococcus lacus]|uniref:Uncharacterized protein n=1 Tax=Deinococcus lacus TaxID=392561 RepID=A0ABW1YE85_9DEIO
MSGPAPTFRRTAQSFTLSWPERVYSFDLEGRPLTWFESGTLYKRSLGSEVLGRRQEGGQRQRWKVPDHQIAPHFDRLHTAVLAALAAQPEPELQRAAAWTPSGCWPSGAALLRLIAQWAFCRPTSISRWWCN